MGRVVHFEIHASDPEALVSFYSNLFGWTITKWEGPMDYWLISTGPPADRGIDGGLVKRHGGNAADGQPVNAFVCTIGVDSVQESLDKALALGGLVAVPIMPVPGVGQLCYAKDPDGNIFGMLQPDAVMPKE